MLFKRRPKWPELQLTERQRAAMAAAPKRKAKKLQAKPPLLAELIEVEEIDLDALIDKRKDMAASAVSTIKMATLTRRLSAFCRVLLTQNVSMCCPCAEMLLRW